MILKKDISILGCGWLGFPLAKMLISKGYTVKGSTTTHDKIKSFAEAKIVPYLVQFNGEIPPKNLSVFLETDVLVIAIPPGRKNADKNNNFRNMAMLVSKALSHSPIKQLIFISSTSIYGDTNREVNEYTTPKPDDASGELLLEVENQLIEIPNLNICVLRLSGLIGPDRHPGRFFGGKANIANGLAPVNLIHLEDVIGIILNLIEREDATGIYIGSAPSHPTKKEFYTLAAKQTGLPAPSFRNELVDWKVVNGEQTAKNLNYHFVFGDLLKWASKK
ncbi:MAG: NAD-dependent epimerase/dehydratase [Daejeonella sp.]|nr:NAD-dependent epimerase/dehydratase [Daejeonella sp.]